MFGWVDFSEEERQRAFEIMELARIPGAIDELGLGTLRDGFSNKLFPGTSTLHTHARYYFLTVYLMKYLEEEYSGHPLETIQHKLTEGEKDTARALIAWADNHGRPQTGITGSGFANTNRWVKQTPTYMNWAAAQTYGLIKDPGLKLNSFLRVVAHSKPKATPEDEEFSNSFTSGLWNVPLECYFQWKAALQKGEEISLELSPEESSQLKNVICQQWPRSLYAALLESPERLLELSEAASLSDGGKALSNWPPSFKTATCSFDPTTTRSSTRPRISRPWPHFCIFVLITFSHAKLRTTLRLRNGRPNGLRMPIPKDYTESAPTAAIWANASI